MALIQYAFRDDPLNVYMLTEGAVESNKYTQIITFRKREVALSFLDDTFYLDSRAPAPEHLTPVGEATKRRNWRNPLTFVAKVDSQVEFIIKPGLFEKLTDSFYPVWKPNVLLDFFGDQPSGFIIFLRVYRTVQPVDEHLLEKGRQGSSQIMRLYKEQDAVSVETEIIEPVLSDNRFAFIKEEILYTLKKENAFISLFQNDLAGKELLKARIEASKLVEPKSFRRFDPTAEVDMAQTDYKEIFREICRIAPTMQNFVKYVSNIKPAQMGETDYLMPVAKRGDDRARQRILEMNMRTALRYALSLYKTYDVDIEDAVQESLLAIVIAFEKYSPSGDNKFSTYAHLWMRQSVDRYLPIGEYVARLPVHFMERTLPILRFLHSHECEACCGGEFCNESVDLTKEILECNEEEARRYLFLLTPPASIEEMVDNDTPDLPTYNSEQNVIERITEEEMQCAIRRTMESITDRQRFVLERRYGISGTAATLEEVGQELNLTRERIRQIEKKALQRMRHPSRAKGIKSFY